MRYWGLAEGGDRVQREFSLELGKGLLLRPAASDEVPQCVRAEPEVSGDRRILEVAVIGGEEIELVIAPTLVSERAYYGPRPAAPAPTL